jgi:glycosyltransferase involved in cell wall biosynthesis
MSKKVVYILSQVDKAVAFEWVVEEFKKTSIVLVFILINDRSDTPFSQFLERHKIEYYTYPLKTKKSYPFTAIKIAFLLRKLGDIIVHVHLFEGGLIGLFSAKLANVKKRIFTRHHSTSHLEYFPNAVKYDKLNNWMATKIVAISENVKSVLINNEGVSLNKIEVIEHCFKLENFKNVKAEEVSALRLKYEIPEGKIIIGTISRYVKWKGLDFVIEAFKEVQITNPKVHLLLANSGGNYENIIRAKLNELPQDSYTEIKFESNLYALYHLLDIFCHVPINLKVEAYGQTYVEALAAGISSVYTLSGIANDFVRNEQNALVVDYENSDQIANAIQRLLSDNELKDRIIKNGKKSVQKFDLPIMINKLERLYLSN